jgi:transposase InsO family protein
LIYGLIQQLSSAYPVSVLCRLLSVSRSGYYAFVKGDSFVLSADQARLRKEVASIFADHNGRYGSRRIQAELRDRGWEVGRDRVRSLMRSLGLKAIQPASFVPKTTQKDPSRARSPNLLLGRDPPAEGLREVLVGDITYWPAERGWWYLSVWMDLFSRRILGWQLEDHMEASLVICSLQKALSRIAKPRQMIVHSDGGTQYKARAFRQLLSTHQCLQSMTRIDNHYDNAFIESLFSRIKAELMGFYPSFATREEARLRIFEYIDAYYNTQRRHSGIGYLSPIVFENRWRKEKSQ